MRNKLLFVSLLAGMLLAALVFWVLRESDGERASLRVKVEADDERRTLERTESDPLRAAEGTPHGAAEQEPVAAAEIDLWVRVTDAAGDPVGNALVYLIPDGLGGVDDLDWRTPHAKTDSNGYAAVRDAHGSFHVNVRARGFLRASRLVHLREAGPARMHIRLDRGVGISGRVVLPRDRDGEVPRTVMYEPIRAATGMQPRTWTYPGPPGAMESGWGHVEYDRRGDFAIDGLEPGPYELEFRGPGVVWRRLEVRAPRQGLVVRLDPSATVVVRVRDWFGRPADVLRADLYRSGTRERVSGLARRNLSKGEMRIRDAIPPGRYRLEAELHGPRGVWQGERSVVVEHPGQTLTVPVTLRRGPRLVFSLADGTSMHGFLIVYHGAWALSITRVDGSRVEVGRRTVYDGVRYVDERRITPRTPLPDDEDDAMVALHAIDATVVEPRVDRPVTVWCTSPSGQEIPLHVLRGSDLVQIDHRVKLTADDLAVLLAPGPVDLHALRLHTGGEEQISRSMSPGAVHRLLVERSRVELRPVDVDR